MTLLLTPEQYAVLEQARGLVEARRGKRVSKEMAVAQLARLALASADNRSKVRHQVIVHINADSGEGFYDTDRGLLPAEPAAVEEAMKSATIMVAADDDVLPGGSEAERQVGEVDAEQGSQKCGQAAGWRQLVVWLRHGGSRVWARAGCRS